MERREMVALAIFSSYFLIILGLFTIILRSLRKNITRNVGNPQTLLYAVLALFSFAHTWYYMFKFLSWSFHNYERSAHVLEQQLLQRVINWLMNTELFEQAWYAVCQHTANWWWSEQLCIFTVGAWTIFLATEGWIYQVKHVWAYMLLGQLVAISVASNLFYLALTVAPSPPRARLLSVNTLPPLLWISVLLSLGTVGLSPYTSEQTFLLNLLTMHILIFIPFLPLNRLHLFTSLFVKKRLVLWAVASCALVLRVRTILAFFSSLQTQPTTLSTWSNFYTVAKDTLYSHPAQSSIGWDVIWTAISYISWTLTSPLTHTQSSIGKTPLATRLAMTFTLVLNPVGSVGVLAPAMEAL